MKKEEKERKPEEREVGSDRRRTRKGRGGEGDEEEKKQLGNPFQSLLVVIRLRVAGVTVSCHGR